MARRRLLLLVAAAVCGLSPGGAARCAEDATLESLLGSDRPADASALLRRRLAASPEETALWTALGNVERLRCDLDASRAAFERALARDCADPEARAGLAETWLLDAHPERALALAEQALATPRGRSNARAWRARTLALVDLGRLDMALDSGERAVRLAPLDPRTHESLARALYRRGDMAASGRAYRRATEIDPLSEEGNLRLGNGFAPRLAGAPWTNGVDAAAFRAAVGAFEAGDLDESGRMFLNLVRGAPDAFKYRLGLGLVRVAVRRRNEVRLGGDSAARYLELPAPEWARLGEVVRGHEGLDPRDRRALLVAVLPARPWWDALVAAGATHEVFGIEECLTDASCRADLRDRATFDGRPYEHLRGVGGMAAATGAEKLREAAEFGFHTFAHEFAHQVLSAGFSPALRAEVEGLYERARKSGRCLDWYAASNADEYFAQGYEALVSHVKRGCLKDTERHTREELARVDPDLHAFLLRHMDLSHESPESLEDFRRAVR